MKKSIENRNESPEKSVSSKEVPSVKSSSQVTNASLQFSAKQQQQLATKNSNNSNKKLKTMPTVKLVVNKKKAVKNGIIKSNSNNLIEKMNELKLIASKKQQQRLIKFASPKLSITKRMCQMQKHIQELKMSNKEFKYENEYLRKAALRSMTNFICAKELQEELQRADLKCKDLEMQLNQKNEIIEKYQLLLREISSNVNILMKELEYDNKSDEHMQKKLKKLNQIKQKSDLLTLNPMSMNNFIHNKTVPEVHNDNNNNNNTFSSSSDTLIDADLSFETPTTRSNSEEPRVIDFQFRPIQPAQYKAPSALSSFDGSLSMENNCLSNQDDDDDDDDEDEDDESITLPLDDISINTIPTSEIQNSFYNDSSTPISQNEDFQHGLNELDQKIFKAKMLLESIKIK